MSLWKTILIYIAIGLFGATAITCVCCAVFIKPTPGNADTAQFSIYCEERINLELNETVTLNVSCSDEAAAINLIAADKNIIEIDRLNITAKAVGNTYIRVNAKVGNKSVNKNVYVVVKERIEEVNPELNFLSSDRISLKIGKSESISYSITPEGYKGTAKVTTKITDPDIASISGKKVTALKAGSTNLEIYLNDNLVKTVIIVVTSSQNAVVTPPEGENANPNLIETNQNATTTSQNEVVDDTSNTLGGNDVEPIINQPVNSSEPKPEDMNENSEENNSTSNQSSEENNPGNLDNNKESNTSGNEDVENNNGKQNESTDEGNKPENQSEIINFDNENSFTTEQENYTLVITPGNYCQTNDKTLILSYPLSTINIKILNANSEEISVLNEIQILNKTNGINVVLNHGGNIILDARNIINLNEEISFTIAIDSLNLSEKIIVLI